MLLETLYPYSSMNDDRAERPFLHGAYGVTAAITNGDTIAPDRAPVKRFFIHRRGYIIFESSDGKRQDFKLDINRDNEQFIQTDYKLRKTKHLFRYDEKDSLLTLQYADGYILKAKALNWKNLPALQNRFHWMVDVKE
jgi:hypothetical protein